MSHVSPEGSWKYSRAYLGIPKVIRGRIKIGIGFKYLLIIQILLFGLIGTSHSIEMAPTDILLNVATQCINRKSANYCSSCVSPRGDSNCFAENECKKTIDVWSENEQFVAIREAKMCGCPKDFVHGLAMPRVPITGVEDPSRDEGIWEFAWEAAKGQINSGSIALAVNPKLQRSQNQLHVHMARLDPKAISKFSQYPHAYIHNLSNVWKVANSIAAKSDLLDYGVLVTQSSSGQYMVLVTPKSSEKEFLIWNCN